LQFSPDKPNVFDIKNAEDIRSVVGVTRLYYGFTTALLWIGTEANWTVYFVLSIIVINVGLQRQFTHAGDFRKMEAASQ
jgi:hypothetical protein